MSDLPGIVLAVSLWVSRAREAVPVQPAGMCLMFQQHLPTKRSMWLVRDLGICCSGLVHKNKQQRPGGWISQTDLLIKCSIPTILGSGVHLHVNVSNEALKLGIQKGDLKSCFVSALIKSVSGKVIYCVMYRPHFALPGSQE